MNLTKREQFAMAAMQGVFANPDWDKAPLRGKTQAAVDAADELIAELDRTAPKCPKCEDGGTGPLCAKHVSYGSTCKESLPVEHHFPDVKEMVPDEDGWIPHNPGDPMPCKPNETVTVMLRNGGIANYRGFCCFWGASPKSPKIEIIKWKLAE